MLIAISGLTDAMNDNITSLNNSVKEVHGSVAELQCGQGKIFASDHWQKIRQ
jgi:hypothetical protein